MAHFHLLVPVHVSVLLILIHSNLSTTATLRTEESGHYAEVAINNFFGGEYNMLIILSSCLLYLILVIQSYIIYREKNTQKNFNNVLNQNVNMTKQARFTTFSIIILDNNIFKICLVQQDKWKTNQNMIAMINHQIECTIQIKFHDHFSVAEKIGHSRAVILAMHYFGHALVAVAVVERFKQKSVYRLSTATKGLL